jgi:inosine-uridine nucleoside N-ribohydrolase
MQGAAAYPSSSTAIRVSTEVGLLDVPVLRGASGPLVKRQAVDAADFHGRDGLGGEYRSGDASNPAEGGVQWLVERIRRAAAEQPVTLVAVGPLTDIALALKREPRLPALVERLIVMGGAFDRRGNITPYAEFNFHCDPHAADVVCAAGFPLTIVPLNVTEQVALTKRHVEELEARTGGPTLASRLLRASMSNYAAADAIDACFMHDALAAALISHPDLVKCEERAVRVVTDGSRAGESVAVRDAARRPARIALGVDAGAARELLIDALAAIALRGGA